MMPIAFGAPSSGSWSHDHEHRRKLDEPWRVVKRLNADKWAEVPLSTSERQPAIA